MSPPLPPGRQKVYILLDPYPSKVEWGGGTPEQYNYRCLSLHLVHLEYEGIDLILMGYSDIDVGINIAVIIIIIKFINNNNDKFNNKKPIKKFK